MSTFTVSSAGRRLPKVIVVGAVALGLLLSAAAAQTPQGCPTQAINVPASTYTLPPTVNCQWIFMTSGAALTVNLPPASLSFQPGVFQTVIYPQNGGSVTLNAQRDPNSGIVRLINGVTSLPIPAGQPISLRIGGDSNWYAVANVSNASALVPFHTDTKSSKTFDGSDFFANSLRSNSGAAMTDTFPLKATTNIANGSPIWVTNVDMIASDTITAATGTTIEGGATYTLAPLRGAQFVYDATTFNWRHTTMFNVSLPSYTPTITIGGSSGGLSYSSQVGRLEINGNNTVHAEANVTLSGLGGATGAVCATLPSPLNANAQKQDVLVPGLSAAIDLAGVVLMELTPGSASGCFFYQTPSGFSPVTEANLLSTTGFAFAVDYLQ